MKFKGEARFSSYSFSSNIKTPVIHVIATLCGKGRKLTP